MNRFERDIEELAVSFGLDRSDIDDLKTKIREIVVKAIIDSRYAVVVLEDED